MLKKYIYVLNNVKSVFRGIHIFFQGDGKRLEVKSFRHIFWHFITKIQDIYPSDCRKLKVSVTAKPIWLFSTGNIDTGSEVVLSYFVKKNDVLVIKSCQW